MAEVIWSIQHKHDTAANWTSDNPLLLNGQIGLEFNGSIYDKFKIGDGVTLWNSLPYFSTPSGGDVTGPASSTDNAIARFDGTTGKIIQNSASTISDTGEIDTLSVKADYFEFDTSATPANSVGRFIWDDTSGTAQLGLKGGTVMLQVGQEMVVMAHNDSGTSLTDGQLVYISGAQGNRLAIKLALANSDTTSLGTIGMVTEPIGNNQNGFVTITGIVNNLDTSALTEGQVLYLSDSVAGAFTTTRPVAPNKVVRIGYVQRAHATVGSIFVKVSPGIDIRNLNDVNLSVVPANGDTLLYNSGVWSNSNLTANVSLTSGQVAVGTALNNIGSSTGLTYSSNILVIGNILRLTSATLGTAVAGNFEFNSDKFTGVITTGAARKEFALNDIALTSGRVVITTTNGRLTDDAEIVWKPSANFSLQITGSTTRNVDYASYRTSGSFNTYQSFGSWDAYGSNSPGGTILAIGGFRASQWAGITFHASGAERWRINNTGNLSNTGVAGLAYIDLKAGTTSLAPIKLTDQGTSLLSTPVNGTFEYGNSVLYFTTGGVRKIVSLL